MDREGLDTTQGWLVRTLCASSPDGNTPSPGGPAMDALVNMEIGRISADQRKEIKVKIS